jgi:hypothetical protein
MLLIAPLLLLLLLLHLLPHFQAEEHLDAAKQHASAAAKETAKAGQLAASDAKSKLSGDSTKNSIKSAASSVKVRCWGRPRVVQHVDCCMHLPSRRTLMCVLPETWVVAYRHSCVLLSALRVALHALGPMTSTAQQAARSTPVGRAHQPTV